MAPHPVTGYISESAWNFIEDKFSPFAKETLANLIQFMEEEILPAVKVAHAQLPDDPVKRWQTQIPIIAELKEKAKKRGLWNLFLSKTHYPQFGVPLTNLEYGVMAEVLAHAGHIGPEVVNCSAPDTGNMEVLARYGSPEQQQKWLIPLLNGEIRSAFAMTEKNVASSDARNIRTSIRQEGNEIVINGHKWWISGAGDPRTKVHLVMGKSDPENQNPYNQQSVVIVPADAPGVKIIRPMKVFGYDDAPEGHCEIIYENVRVPLSNLVLGWGRGFEIIQGRLGPGRIHHCMRSIGAAEAALNLLLTRVTDPQRKTFGKFLYEHGTVVQDIAKSRAEIEAARLLVLSAAAQIDKFQAKGALKEIGIAKFVVPSMALTVIDRAIQCFGAEGVSQDTELASRWAGLRTLRIADGPDAVHLQQVGQRELRRAPALTKKAQALKQKQQELLAQNGLKAHLQRTNDLRTLANPDLGRDTMSFASCVRKLNVRPKCMRRGYASSSKSVQSSSSHSRKPSAAPATGGPSPTSERQPRETIHSHATLPPPKMRALISLYHQAETWVTPETLLERIDQAFVPKTRSPSGPPVFGASVLKAQLSKIRSSPKMTQWTPGQNSSIGYAPGSQWSDSRDERELLVLEALYGTDSTVPGPTRPGLELVQEAGKEIKRTYLEDRGLQRAKELDDEDDLL